ncbi:MAG: hypothetical protein JNL62_28120, partial [Bryobacterales bacterium]|nr:hypothetical protein [Bryobacterales bacterium]
MSAGRIIDNRTIMSLPVMSNSIALVSQFSAGVSTSGNNQYHQVIAIGRASDYTTAGGVGGNEWSIDGAPNNGRRRWVSMAPVTDTIQEMKVETMNFDAAVGHTTGINFAMMSRAGTNEYHGNLTWQHWQQRWQGTPFFQKQLYYRRISEAETVGNTVLANQLRNTDKQASGRSNTYAGTVGGPVTIPKLVNGRNRLFFFFSFNGFKDAKPVPAAALNITLPTMAARMGDFSRMLQIGPQYQLHDPLSVRPDPGRATHVVRDPLPGNIVPRSRMINPMYE